LLPDWPGSEADSVMRQAGEFMELIGVRRLAFESPSWRKDDTFRGRPEFVFRIRSLKMKEDNLNKMVDTYLKGRESSIMRSYQSSYRKVVEICRKCGMSVFGLDEEARCEIWLEAREERLSTGCSIVHMGRNCEEDTNESSTAAVGESEPVDPKDVDIDVQPNDSGDMESLY
jgi:hypothetical protein